MIVCKGREDQTLTVRPSRTADVARGYGFFTSTMPGAPHVIYILRLSVVSYANLTESSVIMSSAIMRLSRLKKRTTQTTCRARANTEAGCWE